MKRILYLIFLLTSISIVGATLNCTIQNATCSDTIIYRMANLTNTHAQHPNQTTYDFPVCCSETGGTIVLNNTGIEILKLSNVTNAHVQQSNETGYNHSIYIGVAAGNVTCTYSSINCTEACLGTFSTSLTGHSNAHVGDCTTDPYATYLCCEFVAPGVIVTAPSGDYGLKPSERLKILCEEQGWVVVDGQCVPPEEPLELPLIQRYWLSLVPPIQGYWFYIFIGALIGLVILYNKKRKAAKKKKEARRIKRKQLKEEEETEYNYILHNHNP